MTLLAFWETPLANSVTPSSLARPDPALAVLHARPGSPGGVQPELYGGFSPAVESSGCRRGDDGSDGGGRRESLGRFGKASVSPGAVIYLPRVVKAKPECAGARTRTRGGTETAGPAHHGRLLVGALSLLAFMRGTGWVEGRAQSAGQSSGTASTPLVRRAQAETPLRRVLQTSDTRALPLPTVSGSRRIPGRRWRGAGPGRQHISEGWTWRT